MTTTIMALAKSIIVALTAACGVFDDHGPSPDPIGVSTDPTSDAPDEVQKPLDVEKGHMFCCNSTTAGSGEGCVLISEQNANSCKSLLYCDGPWHSNDGTVTCD